MAQSTSFIILVAALLINSLSYCSAENLYCVTPTATACSSCPQNSAKCTTLSKYAQKSRRYFTSDSTMVFLSGEHSLSTNITVANVVRLTMLGELSLNSVATIVCSGSVGLSFTNMVDLKILSLVFTSCSREYNTPPVSDYALLLQSTWYSELVNCSFHSNYGAALVVNNTNITLAGKIDFTHNHCDCEGGSSITALSSTMTISGNTTFLENIARSNSSTGGGGAIYATENTVVSFSGISNFINNLAYFGGAIYASHNSVFHFNGTSSFVGNSADIGGAIFTSNNTLLSFNGPSNFTNNRADYGGAISTIANAVFIFSGTSNFANNLAKCDGGAILTLNSAVFIFIKTSNFIYNSAKNGGAISASNDTILSFNGISNFISNSAYSGGGAILTSDNTLICFNRTSNFINNYAGHSGGAIYAYANTTLSFNGTKFINNSADYFGGAIFTLDNAAYSFTGNSLFTNNSASLAGGAIASSNNTAFTFHGSNNFVSNSADIDGGTISASSNTVFSFNGNSNFINNLAEYGGGISSFGNTALSFNGTSNFINNSASKFGGAISVSSNTVLDMNGASNFLNNSASMCGGATFASSNTVLSFNGTSNFNDNSASKCGGAISASNNTVVDINGTSNFRGNSAHLGGGIFSLDSTVLTFNGTNNFIGNSASAGGGIYTEIDAVINFNGNNSFLNNLISSSGSCYGGAILLNTDSTLLFSGSINFTSNGHTVSRTDTIKGNIAYGGGVYVGVKGTLSMLPDTTVFWNNNHATYGGAIYVTDVSPVSYCASVATYVPKEDCFFQLPGRNLSNGIDVQFVFKDNLADAAGSVLYGGVIDNCKLTALDSYSSGEVFDKIAHIEDESTTSRHIISSVPLHICPCNNSYPVCTYYASNYTVYPGETFQVPVLAVGQRNGIVPSTVRSIIQYPHQTEADLKDDQYLQKITNICTNINYTVSSLSPIVYIELHAEGNPCAKSDISYISTLLFISVNLNQTCPPGFNISKIARSCVCEQRLAQYTDKCHITDGIGRITHNSSQQFWVGYDDQSHELILHSHCPFDYCISHDEVFFSLNNTDMQCAYNRSGLLCGACKKGYSLVLGTSQCKQCTNSHLVLLIPFALMGITLVLFLLVCKLTIATGTLSGLVFYANIVGINRTIFLPANSILSVFIAWLNLDFGIETCFYNGLDTYSKTWLQFVFPVYLWVLVGLIIIVSHYSHRFARLLGNNPVSVLATLILLSYTKILRTLIAVVYVTYLEYPTYNKTVWLYDANINYLGSKHIPLFLVAVLFFLFLFFPYTLLLLFGQWLQAISHLRLFSWVNSARLKPFMDSYHAPYKAKHRYWPGLLLVLRFVLFLVFAIQFNPQQDRASINLLAILVGTGMLSLWVWISGGVYRNWYLDALEGSFTLNMIILAASTLYTYHVSHSEENQLAVGYTSISIAFATFIGILVFQLANVTGITQYLKRKCAALKMCKSPIREGEREIDSDNESLPDRLVNTAKYEQAPQTTQECANADYELTETSDSVSEAPRRLISVYTYSSLN